MREGFAKDRHTYGDGKTYAPNYTDGSTDDIAEDETQHGNLRQSLTSVPPGVKVTPFTDQGMGDDSEIVEVDVNGVVDQINQRQAEDGGPYRKG